MAEVQQEQSRFAQYLQKKQATLFEEQLIKKDAKKEKLAQGRIKHATGLNAKQLQALIELRTIPSGEAYIAGKKGIQGYTMRMVDPDGQGPLPEFAIAYTNKGKLYSIGGYIPKDESKYDKYRKQYIASIPKGQRKNTKFFNFMHGEEVPVGAKHKDGSYKMKQFQQLVLRNHFLATYIPTIAQEYRDTNQIEKWGRGEYTAAAQAT
ncbi:MAG: hypothetical protein EZS28_009357 [Streblomastix strix]|uniref:Uncharacterized protein n=1 Tax=Streblomastix strix TaxID=222440 RepID=A0A5J4WJS2_9EUKA|nr:MAG: hypothetical protein EZS28_009357 [Streblomastix strix]